MNSVNKQYLQKTEPVVTLHKNQLFEFHKKVILNICAKGTNQTKHLNAQGHEVEVVQLEFTQLDEHEPINVRGWVVEKKERTRLHEKTVSFTLEDKHTKKIVEYLNIYQGLNESSLEYDIDLAAL